MKISGLKIASGILMVAVLTAACGGDDDGDGNGDGGGDAAAAAELEGRGPINYVAGPDATGLTQKVIDQWNEQNPDEKVNYLELPDSTDEQRQQMIQNAETESTEFDVLHIDVVWTAEMAAHRWIEELPQDEFDFSDHLAAPLDVVMYQDRLFAIPDYTDAGLLYYRTDLLDAVGADPPETWDEMEQICADVQDTPEGADIGCYAGQFDKYEGLTVNFTEAVHSAGGSITDADGKPTVDTPEAKAGLDFLIDGFDSGMIPSAAITFKEEDGRRAFEDGELVFHRQWPYQYNLANDPESGSEVAGKFDVAPLPGLDGPGTASLGGWNLAISTFSENKATALEFTKFFTNNEAQRTRMEQASRAPVITALYTDSALQKEYPYLPVLQDALDSAVSRPEVVQYGKTTAVIQDEVYAALNGEKDSGQALSDMQSRLEQLIE